MHDPPADLVYFPDTLPGISRRRRGRGFSYFAPDGTRIDDADERRRLSALAVPPAYEHVWICPRAEGHLQATGRDARGRKQYRYHPDWTRWRARRKFDGLACFGRCLPRLRRAVRRDLGAEAGERDLAVAAVVTLLDRAALRIGHPENVAANGTHGATTLQSRHLSLEEGGIRLDYRSKGGRQVRRVLRDARLHRVFHALDDLPGRELMTWLDADGTPHRVASEEVNGYIERRSGAEGATAKTFRTWAGTLAAFEVALQPTQPTITAMAEAAAARLSNTPTIARNSYVHPAVIALCDLAADDRLALGDAPPVRGLRVCEAALLQFLEQSADGRADVRR